ncbi:MAG: CDP-2,3-bis-(O-geranylgeranyl)-sn-glycerol synthase [Methanobrevibacter sp.]|jgi:CDP-2,3-bis-(O-geranylgeranyl)-sn-glycerol synthase|nr:CDP-2,3-bis-(O-geranylgeranyl)-sn-glycerol synthase [Candidatus Methanovirga basalitermitum]
MDFNVTENIILVLNVVYFLLPAYIANLSGLVFGGKRPIDMGKNFFDGNRIIGDGVTIEGFAYGVLFGVFIGVIEGLKLENLLFCLQMSLLLSFGALVGDAVGSFIKRRLGVSRGKPVPFLDQLDFFVGAILFVSLIVHIPMNYIIIGAILTLILHLVTNTIAYLLGIKDVWY